MKKIFWVSMMAISVVACKEKIPSLTTDFEKCSTNCNEAATQLKDLFQQDPRRVLGDFKGDTTLLLRWVRTLGEAYFLSNETEDTETVKEQVKQNMMLLSAQLKSDGSLKTLATLLENELSFFDIIEGEDGASDEYVSLTGTYGYELPGNGGSGELKVSMIDDKSIRFSLKIVRPGSARNQGMMEGIAMLEKRNTASFKTNEYGGNCELHFAFDPEGVEIKTLSGDAATCGFNYGMSADNAYQIKDKADPFMSRAENKMAESLIGAWQSTEDPNSEISFEDGIFTSLYEGKVVERFPYQFYAHCPEICEPVGDTPSFSVFGQDLVCYAIVSVGDKNLEISMIGGRGNTLAYVRK